MNFERVDFGREMYELMGELFPICRSITGDGVRRTLMHIQKQIPIKVHEIATGTQVFDWTVPKEWNIAEAYIENESGERLVDFANNNLHVMGYSVPVDQWMSREELLDHVYTLEDQPTAIPYVTSYYKERWGFCMSADDLTEKLVEGKYHVVIKSSLEEGALTYADYVIPGETDEEIVISTYICHPSMANNELSGPVVATYLAKWLASRISRYTYRFVFIPETIGSIVYLSQHLPHLKEKMKAGFILSCLGDEGGYSCVASRYQETLADKVAQNVLLSHYEDNTVYPYLESASDQRQYNSPNVDLPVVTLCRSKFAEYPEYHTSLDNLLFVSAKGLQGGFDYVKRCVEVLEKNCVVKLTTTCAPQLGKRGLYPSVSTKDQFSKIENLVNLIDYTDGKNDLIDLSDLLEQPIEELWATVKTLIDEDLFEVVE